MASDLSIVKAALVRLGMTPIDTMLEESSAGTIVRIIYPDLKRAILSMYPWRFSMGKRKLARLAESPLGDYQYAYQLPSDRITGPFTVFTTESIGAKPYRGFEIFEDKLYAGATEIWIDYQYEPLADKFPPYFAELLTNATAAEIANAITDQNSKAELYHIKAWGSPSEGGRGGWFRLATSRDSQQQPPQVIEDFALIEARFS